MNEITQKITSSQLMKPTKDTNFAHESAKILMDVVEQNGWSMALGGKKKHLMYEAWQTVGKYYGYTVRTGDASYVEYGDIKGFEAKAWVIDNKTGNEIGGAEAACLTDEPNWKNKPLFQLKSMAQTRAGAKALRQILGFVAALAGYSPTPAEEITTDTFKVVQTPQEPRQTYRDDPANPLNQDTCVSCDVKVPLKVKSFSLSKYNKVLCYDCQQLQNDNEAFRSKAVDPES